MPCYTYVTNDGEQVEHICAICEYQEEIKLEDGRIAKRDYGADFPTISRPSPACWPMKPCISTGVHADQAQELRNLYKQNGVSIEVNKDGNPIYATPGQMKQDLKLRKFVDKN